MECQAVLIAEPHNPYDPNAIMVIVEGLLVGYLSREDAVRYAPVMSRLADKGLQAGACEAWVAGRYGFDANSACGFGSGSPRTCSPPWRSRALIGTSAEVRSYKCPSALTAHARGLRPARGSGRVTGDALARRRCTSFAHPARWVPSGPRSSQGSSSASATPRPSTSLRALVAICSGSRENPRSASRQTASSKRTARRRSDVATQPSPSGGPI